jgi:hypothetical protein
LFKAPSLSNASRATPSKLAPWKVDPEVTRQLLGADVFDVKGTILFVKSLRLVPAWACAAMATQVNVAARSHLPEKARPISLSPEKTFTETHCFR